MQKLIKIENGTVRMPAWRMAKPVDFCMMADEHLAIVGPNGGGKSMFIDIITGSHPLLMRDPEYDFSPSTKRLVADNIKYITFRDTYGGDNDNTYYLQQRWNQQEIDESTPTTGALLEQAFLRSGEDTTERRVLQQHLYEMFNMKPLLDKYIILLSSGELRKFKLTQTLLSHPRLLIMDNPFIGLDTETRQQLRELLATLAADGSLQIMLVLSKTNDIPDFITHVVPVEGMEVLPKIGRELYITTHSSTPVNVLDDARRQAIISLPVKNKDYNTEKVVEMHNVSIRYGARTILKDLTWTVRNGERWALSGQNGAGKSTLLSLVCADNPQSYACDITLFDHKRGTGETIWDIKRHIGYVSPEMHRAYQRDIEVLKIVASGLNDSVGLYVKPKPEDYDQCHFWLNIFGIDHLAERSFLKLSSGEQRLVLLARAFVKDPELLILDEPLHGLDKTQGQMVREIIDTFCMRKNKTMIMVSHYQNELPNCITDKINLIRHE